MKTVLFYSLFCFKVLWVTNAIADIMIMDAYARSSGKTATSGAVYMMIHNHSGQDDRLLRVQSNAAKKVELHTHEEDKNGTVKMLHVPEGFAIEANGMLLLTRGKEHIMFMGLKNSWSHGDVLDIELIFREAGEVKLEVEVDLERKGGDNDHTH